MESSWEIEQALQAVADFRRDLSRTPVARLDLLEQERRVQQVVNSVGRALMGEVLGHADVRQPEVTINGKQWGNRRDSEAPYTTLFGEVRVSRGIYSQPGGGPVMVPMELRLGIVEGRYTPCTARVLCRAMASMPAEEAAGLLREAGVATVSESTLNRIPKAIAARYETEREQINAELREAEQVPDDAASIQVGLDGVMVPQDGEHAKPRGRRTESPKEPRHEARYGPVNGPGPAANDGLTGRSWHEASVGTLAYYDAEGNHLRTVYLGRMPEAKMATLSQELEQELSHALGQRPDLNVTFASDGDLHQWTILEGIASRISSNATGQVWYLLDFYHAAEYLTKASDLLYGTNSAESHATAAQWRETLKHDEAGAERVLKSLRYHRDELARTSDREQLQGIIDYLADNKRAGRLAYADARANHLPIGTGITEAAAKTVANTRMKRAGARFEQHGGQTVMLFRAALLSERFHRLSSTLERTYTAQVELKQAA
jgi:hypothetical protein